MIENRRERRRGGNLLARAPASTRFFPALVSAKRQAPGPLSSPRNSAQLRSSIIEPATTERPHAYPFFLLGREKRGDDGLEETGSVAPRIGSTGPCKLTLPHFSSRGPHSTALASERQKGR